MNAVNPVHSPSLPATGSGEPSMEEILASIRRIIADDGAPQAADARDNDRTDEREHAAPSSRLAHIGDALLRHEASDIESLGDEHDPAPVHGSTVDHLREGSDHAAPPHVPSPEGHMVETIGDLPPHPLAPHPDVPHPDVPGLGAVEHEPAVIEPRDAPLAVTAHGEPLMAAAAGSSVTSAFNTLAASRFVDNSEQLTGLVREMIRPLVKAWVDEHLPDMVERLVTAEIERMARGGR